jgi:SAM-dependent methyltransferase
MGRRGEAAENTTMVDVKQRAELTRGISHEAIYRAVFRELAPRLPGRGHLLDVGCGRGHVWKMLAPLFSDYTGLDLVRHEGFLPDRTLVEHDLEQPPYPLPDGFADVVLACEVTPCLENPRALVREMARLAKPGGWVVVTNPNCLSLLSLATLLLRGKFNAFQDDGYPFMITPVLEVDLRRMAAENGLEEVRIFYTGFGRIAYTGRIYPAWLARCFPRLCSDHLGLIARKAVAA